MADNIFRRIANGAVDTFDRAARFLAGAPEPDSAPDPDLAVFEQPPTPVEPRAVVPGDPVITTSVSSQPAARPAGGQGQGNKPPKPPKDDDPVQVYRKGARVAMWVKRKTGEKWVDKGRAYYTKDDAMAAAGIAPKPKVGLRVVQLIETGQIMKVSDAEAARLVEAEEAGYII
jgi:hypothetical protein